MKRIVLAGGSGLVGSALRAHWDRAGGVEVRRLVRRPAREPGEIEWDPAAGRIDRAKLRGCAAVVNLAGENVGEGRWTAARKRAIRDSRLQTTGLLARAITEGDWRPGVWINASAIGYYGDGGDAVLDEMSPQGGGFLASVCGEWEAATRPAAEAGVRVVRLRLGVVLDGRGGALAKLLPVFRSGLGGPIGDGRKWMSWIGVEELCRIVDTLVRDESLSGAVNAVAPEPVRNGEFAAALARVLGRPAVVRTPEWALRLAFGEMAEETVLASQRAVPGALLAAGHDFSAGGLEAVLRAAVTRPMKQVG